MLLGFFFTCEYFEKKKLINLFLAGLFIGFSIFIKQAVILLAIALFIFIFLKNRKIYSALVFSIGTGIPLMLLLYWIFYHGIFDEFIYWTIIFNFEIYAKMADKLPTLNQWLRILVYIIPFVYLLSVLALKNIKIFILGLFCLSLLPMAFARFEFIHLQPAITFIILGIALVFSTKMGRMKNYLLTAFITFNLIWVPIFYKNHYGKFVFFFDQTTLAVADRIKSLTNLNDSIYVLGSQPILYPLSNRLPAGRVFTANLPWNMLVAEPLILKGLMADKPALVVRDSTATIDDTEVADFTANLNQFVNEYYYKIDEIGTNEILVPKNSK
ncbi:hypothetical protein A2159_02795 [Candidatus Woesebacteria bacterium RBG_13_34_9]|uniref:Glycosyltransferase RgtA/B/C/D-like domain-containing protein n=1 Tax=Candidatus Woesebacteria bacterium RBG_13_34_9 TaxID=1802477 RepID=A0A1F7X1X9_9BACT|nr:MAG: hypothetical protein A2159_02795 [Candidatus Woesebacteria bacterium RBG_13_34_9]